MPRRGSALEPCRAVVLPLPACAAFRSGSSTRSPQSLQWYYHFSLLHAAPCTTGSQLCRDVCGWLGVPRCRRWGRVFEGSQAKQERDPALGRVLLPVALRAAARRLPTSLRAADASPEHVLSVPVPACSKTEAFQEGKTVI